MRLSYVSAEFRELVPIEAKDWWESVCLPLDDVLKKMHGLGLRDIELCSPHVRPDMSPNEIARVKDSLSTYDIKPVCIDSDAFRWSIDDSGLKEAVEYIELANKLAVNIVRLFSGPTNETGWSDSVDMLKESAKHARENGVKLGVENIWDHHFGKITRMKEGLEEIGSESAGALVDVSNFYVAEEDPVVAPNVLGNKILHMHVRDVSKREGKFVWQVMGGGDISKNGMYPKIIGGLEHAGYNGCLSIEPLIFPAEEILVSDVQFMTPLLLH